LFTRLMTKPSNQHGEQYRHAALAKVESTLQGHGKRDTTFGRQKALKISVKKTNSKSKPEFDVF
jgi:hypothetical protein